MTHLSVAGSHLEVPEALVRLSVGIEGVADLIEDLTPGARPLVGPRVDPRAAGGGDSRALNRCNPDVTFGPFPGWEGVLGFRATTTAEADSHRVSTRCHARPVGPKPRRPSPQPGASEQETDPRMFTTSIPTTHPREPRLPAAGTRVRAGKIVANLSTAALYEAAVRDGRGRDRRRRAARRAHGDAHRPLAEGQVHRPRAVERGRASGGATSTTPSARSTTTGSAPG